MDYTQNIQLDFNTASPRLVVYAKQGDADTRTLHVSFTKDGNEYKPSTSNSIMLRLRTPDGQSTVNNYTPNSDGTVDVTLTPEMLLTAGRAFADLVEYDGGEHVLSTMTFIVYISDSPSIDPSVTSTDNDTFFNFIGNAQRAVEIAQGYANQAAVLASQMTMVAGEAAVPGVAPTLTLQDNQYILHAPSVRYIPQVSVTESIHPSVTIVASDGTAGTGEDSNLVKNLVFSFELPSGVIPEGAISSINIQDYAVESNALDSEAVVERTIANDAVTTDKICDSAITFEKIRDSAVIEDKIYNNAVTTSKISDNAVTFSKLESSAVRRRFSNKTPTWTISSPAIYEGYPAVGNIVLDTINDLSSMRPEVIFGMPEAISGNFAPVAATHTSGVYIYAKESASITIPVIELWR